MQSKYKKDLYNDTFDFKMKLFYDKDVTFL